MKKISITGSCYNEAGNIEELYTRCLAVLKKFPQHDYEFVFADNCSTDNTRDVLRTLAARDPMSYFVDDEKSRARPEVQSHSERQ